MPALRPAPDLRQLIGKTKLPKTKGEDLKFETSVGWKQCYQSGTSRKPRRICPYAISRTKEAIPD